MPGLHFTISAALLLAVAFAGTPNSTKSAHRAAQSKVAAAAPVAKNSTTVTKKNSTNKAKSNVTVNKTALVVTKPVVVAKKINSTKPTNATKAPAKKASLVATAPAKVAIAARKPTDKSKSPAKAKPTAKPTAAEAAKFAAAVTKPDRKAAPAPKTAALAHKHAQVKKQAVVVTAEQPQAPPAKADDDDEGAPQDIPVLSSKELSKPVNLAVTPVEEPKPKVAPPKAAPKTIVEVAKKESTNAVAAPAQGSVAMKAVEPASAQEKAAVAAALPEAEEAEKLAAEAAEVAAPTSDEKNVTEVSVKKVLPPLPKVVPGQVWPKPSKVAQPPKPAAVNMNVAVPETTEKVSVAPDFHNNAIPQLHKFAPEVQEEPAAAKAPQQLPTIPGATHFGAEKRDMDGASDMTNTTEQVVANATKMVNPDDQAALKKFAEQMQAKAKQGAADVAGAVGKVPVVAKPFVQPSKSKPRLVKKSVPMSAEMPIMKVRTNQSLRHGSKGEGCSCAFKNYCTCNAAIEFMNCISNSCMSGGCDCHELQYKHACLMMADTCSSLNMKCEVLENSTQKATCIDSIDAKSLPELKDEPKLEDMSTADILKELKALKEDNCEHYFNHKNGWVNADEQGKIVQEKIDRRIKILEKRNSKIPDMHCYHDFKEYEYPEGKPPKAMASRQASSLIALVGAAASFAARIA
eukprot:gnl/TRDRNA2_/TRDRNA2_81431_c0_seq4.p1 gnl/TRDRNA2_/TRDRNA2_81431_c0~~gnl/TRDRNA2_/TRDRNA2_81431_c0_seq4.p1  ORF type:complete len:687 (+),score=222.51 gnl/TRDRNA2_/TRDRNA2_81431_c0_seq4:159-2219(+)